MSIVVHPAVSVCLEDVGPVERREVPYRKMVLMACQRAAEEANYSCPLPYTAGIAFSTIDGERYAQRWYATAVEEGKRLPATAFESTVHTSAPGYASIKLGLTGPMVVLTHGNLERIARLQLEMYRAVFMFVCSADRMTGPAKCYLLEAVLPL